MPICEFCTNEFVSKRFKKTARQRFCCHQCRFDFHKLKKRDSNKVKHEASSLCCSHCKITFTPRRRLDEVFCTDECKIEYHKAKLRETSAAFRLEIIKKCPVCDGGFQPLKTMRQQYCSSKCRNKFPKKIYKALQRCREMTDQIKLDRSHKLLGYSPRQLQEHIQSHPNWQAVKDQDWHLDHIFPIIAFLNLGIRDVAKICCLENLQPLSGPLNIVKNDDYDIQCFQDWLFVKGWWSPLEGTK